MPTSPERYTTPLLLGVILIHFSYAPFTKVEESFNIQATHDILTYGVSWNATRHEFLEQNYDHVTFPGSVPRTFVGAVVLSLLTGVVQLLGGTGTGDGGQVLVRGILGLINAASMLAFRNALSRTFGSTTAVWYMVLQTSQFHLMYYASRTLPNMFAFGITTYAFRNFVYGIGANDAPRSRAWYRESIFLLTFSGVVFRAEIAVLVASLSVFLIGINRAHFQNVVLPAGLVGAASGLFTTVVIDSYFWQRFPMWPEFNGFWYNTVLGKASDWGVSPADYYFTNAIPRLLLNPLTYTLLAPISVISPATRSRSIALLAPSLTFVAIYSALPHKEWRFIIYIIPALTASAALGATWIWNRRNKSFLYRGMAAVLLLSTAASFLASSGLLAISRLNYPGGEAVLRLRDLAKGERGAVHIHADNLACQTGLTRFLEDRTAEIAGRARWTFDKTDLPEQILDPVFWEQFDYALVEKPERAIGKWEVVDVVRSYAGVKIIRPGMSLYVGEPDAAIEGTLLPWEKKWSALGDHMRAKWTRGWWVTVQMKPSLKILRRQRTPMDHIVAPAT